MQTSEKKTLAQLKTEFINGKKHNDLLKSLAWACKRENMTQEETQSELEALYDSVDEPSERQGHHKEIKRAVQNTWNNDGSFDGSFKTSVQMQKASIDLPTLVQHRIEWGAKQTPMDWHEDEVEFSNGLEENITTWEVIKTLHKHCPIQDAVVWSASACNESTDQKKYHRLDEENVTMEDSYYVSVNPLVADGKGVFKRCNAQVPFVECLDVEFDVPFDGRDLKHGSWTNEEAKDIRNAIKLTTQILVGRIGQPTAIVFSGSKSYHCWYRLAKPIPSDEFEAQWHQLLSTLYAGIGIDDAMLKLSQPGRIPRTREYDMACPRCLTYHPDAEISIEDFADKLTAIYTEMHGEELSENVEDVAEEYFEKVILPKGKVDMLFLMQLVNDLGYVFQYENNGEKRFLHLDRQNRLMETVKADTWITAVADWILHHESKAAKAQFLSELTSNMKAGYLLDSFEVQQLRDDKSTCWLFFDNTALKITKDSVEEVAYNTLPEKQYIWKSQLAKNHSYNHADEKASVYERFVEILVGGKDNIFTPEELKERKRQMMISIGYLMHRYIPAEPKVAYYTDMTTEDNEGRTGKGMTRRAIEVFRNTCVLDGKDTANLSGQFLFQNVDIDTDLICFDEMPKDLLERLFSAVTDKLHINKKNRPAFDINEDDKPKMMATSNKFPEGISASFLGRRVMFECSNYFNGLDVTPRSEFGMKFFCDDWDSAEWARFDAFMVRCVQEYLAVGEMIPMQISHEEEKLMGANVNEKYELWLDDYFNKPTGKFWTSDACKTTVGGITAYAIPPKLISERYVADTEDKRAEHKAILNATKNWLKIKKCTILQSDKITYSTNSTSDMVMKYFGRVKCMRISFPASMMPLVSVPTKPVAMVGQGENKEDKKDSVLSSPAINLVNASSIPVLQGSPTGGVKKQEVCGDCIVTENRTRTPATVYDEIPF